ncbi:uncharacterized protein EV422DRAFT_579102 [Fimicolochytrium jonesii]|uniref:uncharacterized protein n=1 Tax=Fimicolochytrium jonesii TaxID=1396493 RepID=UPI0022FDE3D5|nr:uncharacterized protein EV422DRAFT_579102 [Fimicolochytrium jonesii]KAI8819892.1 hypothetical protein EV422DRAFT_579102 [Fimicolochytrium jonesii]
MVRGHIGILRELWTKPAAPTLWGCLEDTWIADLECALRNPAHALQPPATTMEAVWDLANALDASKPQSLWEAAHSAGELASIHFLQAHDVPRPPLSPRYCGPKHLVPWACSIPPVSQCPIDVLTALLKHKAPDTICPPFVLEGIEIAPPSMNFLDILVLPFWTPSVAAFSIQQAFDECVRLAWDEHAYRRWEHNFGIDQGDVTNQRSVHRFEMERRLNALNRFVRDALEARLEVKSPSSIVLPRLARKTRFVVDLQLRSVLAALLSRAEAGGWNSYTAKLWVSNILELGFDVDKITANYRPWFEHHGVPVALLAKHGSAWATELLNGADPETMLNPPRPPNYTTLGMFMQFSGVLPVDNHITKPLDRVPSNEPVDDDSDSEPPPPDEYDD